MQCSHGTPCGHIEDANREMEKEFVYKVTLSKIYGLTAGMIADLGPPDKCCPNTRYPGGPQMCLYRIERVEAWVAANKDRIEASRKSRALLAEKLTEFHMRQRDQREYRTFADEEIQELERKAQADRKRYAADDWPL